MFKYFCSKKAINRNFIKQCPSCKGFLRNADYECSHCGMQFNKLKHRSEVNREVKHVFNYDNNAGMINNWYWEEKLFLDFRYPIIWGNVIIFLPVFHVQSKIYTKKTERSSSNLKYIRFNPTGPQEDKNLKPSPLSAELIF